MTTMMKSTSLRALERMKAWWSSLLEKMIWMITMKLTLISLIFISEPCLRESTLSKGTCQKSIRTFQGRMEVEPRLWSHLNLKDHLLKSHQLWLLSMICLLKAKSRKLGQRIKFKNLVPDNFSRQDIYLIKCQASLCRLMITNHWERWVSLSAFRQIRPLRVLISPCLSKSPPLYQTNPKNE